MNAEKIRNLTDAELAHQKTELSEELFKLKFQLKMGQTESLKKMRELKKDIARVQTIQREKALAAARRSGGERLRRQWRSQEGQRSEGEEAPKKTGTEKK